MPAHTRKIYPRLCATCRKKATVEVFNTYNATHGDYCTTHGNALVKRLNDEYERNRSGREGT